MPPISGGTEAGFSLLEVLVAFAIVAALMSGILTLYSDTGLTAQRATEKTATLEAARSAIARMGTEYPLEPGTLSLTDGPIAIWVEIAPADLPTLRNVTATARWNRTETRLSTLKAAEDAQP